MTTLPRWKELLTKWNDGVWKGAARKFSLKIGVGQPTVSRWIHSKSPVDERLWDKVCKELGVSVDDLMGLKPVPYEQRLFDSTMVSEGETRYETKDERLIKTLTRLDKRLGYLEEEMAKVQTFLGSRKAHRVARRKTLG